MTSVLQSIPSTEPAATTTSAPDAAPIKADELLIKNGRSIEKLDARNALRTAVSLGERIQGGRTILQLSNLMTTEW